jgi:hypothetical protein
MEEKTSSHWTGLNDKNRKAVAELLKHPNLSSETLARRTLQQCGAQGFNVQDVQQIIRTYTRIVGEAIRAGEDL